MSQYNAAIVNLGSELPPFVRELSEKTGVPVIQGSQLSGTGYDFVVAYAPGQRDLEGVAKIREFVSLAGQRGIILLTEKSVVKQPGKKDAWPTFFVRKNVDEIVISDIITGEGFRMEHIISAMQDFQRQPL